MRNPGLILTSLKRVAQNKKEVTHSCSYSTLALNHKSPKYRIAHATALQLYSCTKSQRLCHHLGSFANVFALCFPILIRKFGITNDGEGIHCYSQKQSHNLVLQTKSTLTCSPDKQKILSWTGPCLSRRFFSYA